MTDFKIGQVVYLPTHPREGVVDPYTLQKRVVTGVAYRPSCVGSPFRVLLSRSLNVLDLVPSLASLLKEQHELEEQGEWVPEVGAGLTVLQKPWQDLPFAELETSPERGLLDFVHVYRRAATGGPSRETGSGKISSVYAVWDAENQSVRYAYDVDAVDADGNPIPSCLLAVPEEALRSPEDVAEQVGIPVDVAWATYKPFIVRRLSRKGMSPIRAAEEVEKRSELAFKELEAEMAERPPEATPDSASA